MQSFPVSVSKQEHLLKRMQKLDVREADIEEHFVRSSGKGGQHVNKASTCVQLVHIPTGTRVRCQRERSQALNRFVARQLLIAKIETAIFGKKSVEHQRREKVRRQKRRRSRRSKKKMLEAKRRRSETKRMRKSIGFDE